MEVIKDFYRYNIDNRIFNNMKQQLNSEIEDDDSAISVDEFKKMFLSYFKGEARAD